MSHDTAYSDILSHGKEIDQIFWPTETQAELPRLFKLRKAVLSGVPPSGDFPLRSLGHFEGARGAKPPFMGYSFSASPA